MKRLVIYSCPEEARAKGYINYLIKNLEKIADEVLVVMNNQPIYDAETTFENLNVTFIVDEKKNSNSDLLKLGIETYGYDKISQLNELVLTNNSLYGPFYPLSEMWEKMSEEKNDFWGISFYSREKENIRYLQDDFIVFKKNILSSADFKKYWQGKNLSAISLSNFFIGKGYIASSYMNEDKYKKIAHNPYIVSDFELIQDRCPFIKRDIFFDCKKELIRYRFDTLAKDCFDYLKSGNLYDVDMIWEDILLSAPMSEINEAMHLSFSLPTSVVLETEKNVSKKVALVVYIYPLDMIDYIYNYVKDTPEYVDIFIVNTSDNVAEECKRKFGQLKNKIDFRMQPNRGRDNTALIVTCADVIKTYDYIGFVHAKKSPHFETSITGDDFCRHCFDSLLKNKNYIENVISSFDKNKRLGILVPYLPVFGGYDFLLNGTWGANYDKTKQFLKDFYGLDLKLDPNVYVIGGMFWFRGKAFKTFMSRNWTFEDFPEEPIKETDGLLTHMIERGIPHLAQYDGFYSAFTMPEDYSIAHLDNMYYKLREIIKGLTPLFRIDLSSDIIRYLEAGQNKYESLIKDIFTYWKYKIASKFASKKNREILKIKCKDLYKKIRVAKIYRKFGR